MKHSECSWEGASHLELERFGHRRRTSLPPDKPVTIKMREWCLHGQGNEVSTQ